MNFSSTFFSTPSSKGLVNSTCLLVIHGSRDPRPAQAAAILVQQIQETLGQNALVEFASLECTDSPLHQQIVEFGDRALMHGCQSLNIVPLFLSPGVHVRDDIPEEVSLAEQVLAQKGSVDRLSVDMLPYLGSYPGINTMLAQQIKQETIRIACSTNAAISSLSVILLAHGTRRTEGNQSIEAIAAHLGAIPAYWSVEPKLLDQIRMISARDNRPILVIPYFLFAGGLTDAIGQHLGQIKRHGLLNPLILGEPLGANPGLVDVIVQQLTQKLTLEPA